MKGVGRSSKVVLGIWGISKTLRISERRWKVFASAGTVSPAIREVLQGFARFPTFFRLLKVQGGPVYLWEYWEGLQLCIENEETTRCHAKSAMERCYCQKIEENCRIPHADKGR